MIQQRSVKIGEYQGQRLHRVRNLSARALK